MIMVLSLLVLVLVGCSSGGSPKDTSGDPSAPGETGDPSDPLTSGYDGDSKVIGEWDDFGGSSGGSGGNNTPQAGQLTASEWSDLHNYDFYLHLFQSTQASEKGIFSDYYDMGYFDTLNLVTVLVKNGDQVVTGAKVDLLSDTQEVIYRAVTNTFGYAYLFPQADQLEMIASLNVTHKEAMVTEDYQYSDDNNVLEIDLTAEDDHQDVIELMFVIDTTGSMGDEIAYLKAEIDYVISEVKTDYPNTTIKLALMFYRDFGDEYVTRYFDFTTDIEEQKANLSHQRATGGGDFEEAVDVALDEAVDKAWSSDNTTKLLFHVLDARPHYTQEIMSRYYNALYRASQKGIRVIPVASSGIDKYTEYLLRNEAMMTGGTYVFLTNHSGIGNEHLEATVGETVPEYLNHLLIRLIIEYHTGIVGVKVPYNQQQ